MADQESIGWVLEDDAQIGVSGEPVHIGDGIPGLWVVGGKPLTAAQLEVDVAEFRALVKERGLPLKEVKSVTAKSQANIAELRGRQGFIGGHIEAPEGEPAVTPPPSPRAESETESAARGRKED